ncbi:d7e2c077-36d8-4dd7-935c-52588288f31a [Thermothielavioides terrestris]|uniref:D7e2c077-36d8-4dd7-935c-52588288f31a n=1 Tax=Thermothielavioides terrestris TaxID=2587410 RepID=A0A446B989_9PEZI|nr:d7e2c077-36d8-4dd7-935c-52588288f31a [Thermothielavioides terrestris]
MGSKRDYSDLTADDNDDLSLSSSNKRRREQQGSKLRQAESKADPTYGQRVAFPGLDDDEPAQLTDDDLEFEEHDEALAYLRAVRQEASSVPHVLVAPKAGPQLPPHLQATSDVDRSIYDDGVGDSRGYYHDGAYTAAPSTPSESSSPEPSDIDDSVSQDADRLARNKAALRKAYYASLTAQFLSLRALLHRTPPPHLVAALPPDHGTEVGAFGPRSWTFRVWSRRLRHTDPLPVQVAALDRRAVLRLLRVLLAGKFLRRGHELRERTSRWLWALLARLPDRGEMTYAEVGWVRELGKRAVLMMISMAQAEALREAVEGDLEGEEAEEDDEGEAGFIGEMVVDDDDGGWAGNGTIAAVGENGDGEPRSAGAAAESEPHVTTTSATDGNGDQEEAKEEEKEEEREEEKEEGEIDMDLDEGEVTDDDDPPASAAAENKAIEADIAAAKARLLARLEAVPESQQADADADADAGADAQPERQQGGGEDDADNNTVFDDAARAQANVHATLNMILTVAGELYGQRDLLEFRDPFPAL